MKALGEMNTTHIHTSLPLNVPPKHEHRSLRRNAGLLAKRFTTLSIYKLHLHASSSPHT
jgi:hypothetical protein